MDLEKLLYSENEKPLDRIVYDGGYTRIFRTIGCIGNFLRREKGGGYEKRNSLDWDVKESDVIDTKESEVW